MKSAVSSPRSDPFFTQEGRISVSSHPLRARDAIEAGTFGRDVRISSLYRLQGAERDLWLVTRARSRRDLLFFVRNPLSKGRISERIHRPVANRLMRWMTTPHSFANLRDIRGNGKTTIATEGGSQWCVIQDAIECIERGWPIRGRESRLGITTLNEDITKTFLGVIIEDLESETMNWLFPDMMPSKRRRWGVKKGVQLRRGMTEDLLPLAGDSLFATYPTDIRHKEPTFANGSLEKGRANAHTHGEIIDDPVNEKTWNSPVNIATAIHSIKQLYNVSRTERGFRLIIGNHWCPGDVAEGIDLDPEVTRKWEVFMRSATSCAECKDGYPIDSDGLVPRDDTGDWAHEHDPSTLIRPHMMEEAGGFTPDLDDIRASCGSYHIMSAQYENRPLAGEATLWKASMFGTFSVKDGWWRKKEREEATLNSSSPSSLPTLLLCSDSLIEVADRSGKLTKMKVSDCAVTIAYDPAHTEGANPKASDHAITTLLRTPFDTFALGDCWKGRPDDPLEAVDEFLRIIWRFRMLRLKVGVEKVGFQKTVVHMLRRALNQKRDLEGNVTSDGTGSMITWLRADRVIGIPRSKAQGDKTNWVRESLGPIIQSGALLLNPSIRNARSVVTALEGFPISPVGADIRDSLAMHLFLFDRVPLSPEFRATSRRNQRIRLEARSKGKTVTGYGW